VFRDHLDHCEVWHVGGNNDKGVDIIAVRGNDEHILIQVKKQNDMNKNKGFEVVSCMIGASHFYAHENGISLSSIKNIIITTAKGFSKRAIQIADAALYVSQLKVDLWNKTHIQELLQAHPPRDQTPWVEALRQLKIH
jgi:hypothetical protein